MVQRSRTRETLAVLDAKPGFARLAVMRWRGLEPPRPIGPQGPQPCASTNSATSARAARIVATNLEAVDPGVDVDVVDPPGAGAVRRREGELDRVRAERRVQRREHRRRRLPRL